MAVDFTGATDAADWIGLYLVGQTPGDDGSHDWSYHGSASDTGSLSVVPRAAGEYYVVMLCCDGYTEVSERVVITIGEGEEVDFIATATVTVGDGPFVANAELTVDFTGATDANDWVGLYLVGQTPGDVGSHDWSYHGSASDTGSLTVLPLAAGEYYVVMLCCDGYTEVSERVVITIGEASQCDGQANGAVCDDGNPASAVSLCHAGVCETTTFEQQPLSQCAAFIEPFDVALVTLELAEAACAANAACGGVSDLFCNGMFPGAVDHYALCDGAALVPDAATCVFQAPGSGLPPVVVDCVGAEDETPCDDGDDATPIDICHAGVCESTSYTKTSASQCAGFLEHDVTLVTLTLAQAACDAAPNCGGVSDLFCNGMFPGAVDHYALCDDSGLVDDLSTCVYVDTADAGLVCMDLNADDYVGVDDLLLLLSAFNGTCDQFADDAVGPCVLLPSAFCLLPCCFMLAALPARLPPVSSILTD
jgi:hypothetical protein